MVYYLTIRWFDPDELAEGVTGGLGAVLAGGVGAYAALMVTSGQRRDSLLCHFKGKYAGSTIEVNRAMACPDGYPSCFGSRTKWLDTSLAVTKESAQSLATECLTEVTTAIASTKKNQSDASLRL